MFTFEILMIFLVFEQVYKSFKTLEWVLGSGVIVILEHDSSDMLLLILLSLVATDFSVESLAWLLSLRTAFI